MKTVILDYIHNETGWANPLHPHYELEELTIMQLNTDRDGTVTVSFEYLFNEDGFSKNDRTHILVGDITIGPTGKLIDKQLKETHRGVAAERSFQPKNE